MDFSLNGRMVKSTNARIHCEDSGLQHSVGLFETMYARHGRAFRINQHLDRLQASARQLGLTAELDLSKLTRAVSRTLSHNQLDEARIRLTITAGKMSMLRESTDKGRKTKMTTLVVPSEPMRYDPKYFEDGVTVVIAGPLANPFDPTFGHKTLNYWHRLRTLRDAAAAGAGESIWLNVSNHLASGAVSNIFLVKDDVLLTPFARGEEVAGALPAPVLPGITRGAVIELAESMNIPVQRRMLSVNDLLEADEVFLTNSGWHVLPVSNVEKKQIGEGHIGEITKNLRSALLDLIERETSEG